MISLMVNGKPRTLEGETALPEFLHSLDVDVRLIAVAINGEVIPKTQLSSVTLGDGDVVEIVRMVGGGADREAGKGRLKPAPQKATGRPEAKIGANPGRLKPAPQRHIRATRDGAAVVSAGAGIIGCAIAYELSRRGVSCLLLDSRRSGMAATNAAAGILAPLAEFRRPDALVRLGLESLRLFPTWVERLREDVPDIDVEFTLNGVLRVALDETEDEELRGGLRYRDELGVELVELDSAALREAEPRLSPKVVSGILCPEEGQVSNQLFTIALARAAQKRGTRVIEGSPAVGFRTKGGRVTAVRTPDGDLACDRLVLATGPWTRLLARKLGAEVPTRPVRGQMLALGRMATPIHQTIWGSRGYVVPRANGLVFAGSTVEEVGFRFRTTKRGLAQVRRAAFELVPQLRQAREHFSWAGLRPSSPDGLPIVGPLPNWENVTVATGHFRNGILLAPITAQLLAPAIGGGALDEALAPLSPERFGG